MQSKRSISGTLTTIILILLHFFAFIGLGMSIPVDSRCEVMVGSWVSMLCILLAAIQFFYILLRPSFSAPCSYTRRLANTAVLAGTSLTSGANLALSMTVFRTAFREEVVQWSAAWIALGHGALFWAYTHMTSVFLPFKP